jgi:hypothetical protein
VADPGEIRSASAFGTEAAGATAPFKNVNEQLFPDGGSGTKPVDVSGDPSWNIQVTVLSARA